MKTQKKPAGVKQKIREEKKTQQRLGMALTAAILITIIIISAFIINSMLNRPSSSQTFSSAWQLEAAIVDHLSLTFPNESFKETATNILTQAGYSVDYYSGEKVTVELYRNLPTHGYKLIILRVHSTATGLSKEQLVRVPVLLFTSELYSQYRYVSEQLGDQVFRAAYNTTESKDYFAIGPNFVANAMKGEFNNTLIILMGCEGLVNSYMANAFIEKGAKAYISWDRKVSASHTDLATIILLQRLVTEKKTISQAVENTKQEVGPDPVYNSVLAYYPYLAGKQKIGNIKD
jgi:hypothetical protein